MPRFVHPDLLDTYRRPNPYVEFRTEISAPDAVNVIRRADQFLATPPLVGAMVPANSLAADARGSLVLAPTTGALASFAGEQSFYDLNAEDISRRLKGVAWTMDPAFSRAVARSVTARLQRVAFAGFFFPIDFECQIYRVTKTPGVREKYDPAKQNYTSTAFTDYSFTPLLSPAPVMKGNAIVWDGTNKSTLNFDLSNYALVLENTPTRAAAPDQTGELPRYYIVVRALNAPATTGLHRWLTDTASARTLAGKGTFQKSFWARNNDQEQWTETLFAEVPTFALNVDTYPATGQAVYAVDVGKVPSASGTGRVAFDRFLPPGTAATLELSSTSSSAGFAAVSHGDIVAVRQQLYWLRVTLTSDTPHRASPTVAALGVEWRIPIDASVEGVPALPTREVSMPWPKASIAEGSLAVVRTGVRDYLDTASVIGSTQAPAQLECDIYLASRHPSITRDKWLLLERMSVTNRTPSATDEVLTLLSYASKLKPKIPRKVESISSVHTVQAGTTTGAVLVSPVLPGTSVSGNEYDAKGYYLRVRSTSSGNFAPGAIYTIQGNTGTGQLDFLPVMPAALAVGDVIEVHSGIFTTQAISWNDADLADVWYQLLTTYLGVAPERIGLGNLPRGGKPPRVTDIAPGDATTQAKLKVTMKVSELEPTEDLLAQVSAILGGVTTEIGGQLVYIQLFPLRAPDGTVTVPLPPVVRIFDRRDYGASLQTPPGLEARATVMSATYGVPLTAAAPDNFQKQTTVSVDNDALLWHTKQDLEDLGSAEIPDKIARWFYNTSDNGLYAASALATTMVRALSTGLRVFPFDVGEINPDLMVGDSVVLVTDQYTDYEPSTRTPLRGMLSVRGVLVRVGNLGRTLSMFVPGLLDNVTAVQGGGAGSLTGIGEPVAAPILGGAFDASGQLFVTSQGEPRTSFQRIAVGSIEPTDAFTRGGTNIPGQSLTATATGLIIAPGATAWIKAFAYDAYGNESAVARIQVVREGSGTSDPPAAIIFPLNGETDDLLWNIRFNATPGSGGGGANLTYDIRQKIGFATETSLASGNGTTLPRDLAVSRHPRSTKVLRLILTDTATGLSASNSFTVPAAVPGVDNTGLQFTTNVTEPGGRLVSRLYAKALVADPDTADAVTAGTVRRVPLVGATDSSGNADLGGSAWVNRHGGNINRDSVDTTKINLVYQQLGNTGHAISTMQESGGRTLNRLYAKALSADPDTAESLANGTTKRVTTLNEATGGGRGFSGLDTSGDLARDIISTRKVVGSTRNLKAVADSVDDISVNLLENSSFELAGTDGSDSAAQGWGAKQASGVWTEGLDTTAGYIFSGTKVYLASFSGSQTVPASTTYILAHESRRHIRARVGERYLMRARMRGDANIGTPAGLTKSAYVFVRCYYADASVIDLATAPTITTTASTYALYEGVATIPAGSAPLDYIVFYIISTVGNPTGAGIAVPAGLMWDVRFDNVELVRVSASDSEVMRSIGDTTPIGTVVQNVTNAGHAGVSMQESGGKPINRLYAKALAGDADTADSVVVGTLKRIPLVGGTDSSGNIDLGGTAWVNKHLGNVADTSLRFAAPVANATSDITLIATGSLITLAGNRAFAGAGANWDNQVYSKVGFTGGAFAQTTCDSISGVAMFGLNTDPTLDAVYTSLDYAMYYTGGVGQPLHIYESGAFVGAFGTYAIGDVCAVTYDGSFVRYIKNGTILRAVSVASGLTLFFDSSFHANGSFSQIQFGPLSANNAGSIGAGNFTTGINESGGAAVNRLLAKALAGDANSMDGLPDGLTYARIVSVTSGQVQTGSVAASAITNAKVFDVGAAKLTAGALVSGVTESSGTAVNRLLAKGLAADPNTLDATGLDGVTYKRTVSVNGSGQITPPSSSSRNRCRLTNSAVQSIGNAGITSVNFNTETYDIGGLHDNVTNNQRITVPAGGNVGEWDLTATIEFAANAVGRREITINKNNATALETIREAAISVGGFGGRHQVFAVDTDPTVGDFYIVQVFQDSGGALNIAAGCSFRGAHRW